MANRLKLNILFQSRIMCEQSLLTLKSVVVGFATVGKSSMIFTYHRKEFPMDYVPLNALDIVPDTVNCEFDGKLIELTILDTAGAEDYDRLRPLLYPGTNVFILLFDVSGRSEAYEMLESYWMLELRHHCHEVPIILVASKVDLRGHDVCTISSEQGKDMATKIGASSYMEISSMEGVGLTELFQEVLRIGSQHHETNINKSMRNCCIL